MSKYEELEKELCCPLDIVFKALEDGFYINTELVPKYPSWEGKSEAYSICCTKYFRLNMWHKTIEVDRFGHYLEVYLKDYKKSWWLKEDKSE